MDPLLFLGNEFLRKMTDPSLPEDEREIYRSDFSAYLHTKDGAKAAIQLVRSFNQLRREELVDFLRSTILWYLDWLSSQSFELVREVRRDLLADIWLMFSEEVMRNRTIETLVFVEVLIECSPARSTIRNIFRQTVLGGETPTELSKTQLQLGISFVDSLLTEQSQYALQVLRECLTYLPSTFLNYYLKHIHSRVQQLGPKREAEIMRIIETKREL